MKPDDGAQQHGAGGVAATRVDRRSERRRDRALLTMRSVRDKAAGDQRRKARNAVALTSQDRHQRLEGVHQVERCRHPLDQPAARAGDLRCVRLRSRRVARRRLDALDLAPHDRLEQIVLGAEVPVETAGSRREPGTLLQLDDRCAVDALRGEARQPGIE